MEAHVVEIVVRGHLGPELIVALDGFEVQQDDHGMTHVVGSVVDQAQLFGLLEMFGDLNIEVFSVNRTDTGHPSD